MSPHEHSHDHHHHDEGPHGLAEGLSGGEPGAALDAANQSLAEALHISFSILKWVMLALVGWYLISGIKQIQPSEQALVFRFGRMLPEPHGAGLLLAWPYPIDEVVRLKVNESNEFMLNSHMLFLSEAERVISISDVSRGHGGLDPTKDGALLTGDKGLVHIQWAVTYKIGDVAAYMRMLPVSTLEGQGMKAAEELLTGLVEDAAIELAAGWSTEDTYRNRLDELRTFMVSKVNQQLTRLGAGIEVKQIKAPLSIVPIQVRDAFRETQMAENNKQRMIQDAYKQKNKILNEAAGHRFDVILAALDARDAALATNDAEGLSRAESQLDRLLTEEVEGKAGMMVQNATAYYSERVGRMQNDLKIYQSYLADYRKNPRMVMARVWDEARNQILNNSDIKKVYRPSSLLQLRLLLGPDPEEKRLETIKALEGSEGAKNASPGSEEPQSWHPMGPE